jgi:hypothetical protein
MVHLMIILTIRINSFIPMHLQKYKNTMNIAKNSIPAWGLFIANIKYN